MTKTANINIRIEPEFKQEAKDLLGSFGISVTGVPFNIKHPRYNAETLADIQKARHIIFG